MMPNKEKQENEEIRRVLKEAGVPFPESMNISTLGGVQWLITVYQSQKEIIEKYRENSKHDYIHNKCGEIIDLNGWEDEGDNG